MSFLLVSTYIGLGLTAGDIFLKYWTLTESDAKHLLWISGVIFYVGALTLLGLNFKHHSFTGLVITTIIINIILASAAGLFLFNEVFTLTKLAGIALAVISIFLLI